MSQKRTIKCGRLVRGPNGRYLCRYCGTEVPPSRKTFCSEACIHEWKLRSDPGYAKTKVYRRDNGICCLCGLDTDALTDQFNKCKMAFEKKLGHFLLLSVQPNRAIDKIKELIAAGTFTPAAETKMVEWIDLIVKYPWAHKALRGTRRCLWDMDHTTPVIEDGGQCGLDNLRTLCIACHLVETQLLRKRLRDKKVLTLEPIL
jgi:5-methylcytosine-specific restriction endonuclease McrA